MVPIRTENRLRFSVRLDDGPTEVRFERAVVPRLLPARSGETEWVRPRRPGPSGALQGTLFPSSVGSGQQLLHREVRHRYPRTVTVCSRNTRKPCRSKKGQAVMLASVKSRP
jgi:hypothetical protein